MTKELKFESPSFAKRIKSMLGVDFYRLFHTPLFYIFAALHTARADNHRRNDGRDGKEYVKERRMEQTVEVHAEHTFNALRKARRFKFQFFGHFLLPPCFDINSM